MIAPKTLQFLTKLSLNNDRTWFEEHKSEYIEAKENFEDFIAQYLEQLAAEESDFGLLRVKDCVFRIYRDVRFSKNKAPYKNHLAAGINKGGKRVHVPGYYLHISPGASLFAGGIWRPEPALLSKIRQEIDYNFEEFSRMVQGVRASGMFDGMEDEEALIRPPKGYSEDNTAIQFIKMKNFIFSCSLSDKEITAKNFLSTLVKGYQALKPFNAFIERALD